jgi:tetratricopeptide (TPR) repeat protein
MPDQDKELKLAQIQSTITDHYQRGDFQLALKASQALLAQTEEHFGIDHPATASAYNNVGLMQKLLGDFIEARTHYNQAMRIYGKVVGRDHASYAMSLHNLGALNKSQVHFDSSLKATERLALVETALEYLEEAWGIRKAELGDEHPHTVATRSSFGSTLAVQVLHQHKSVESAVARGERDGKSQSTRRLQLVSLNSESVTQQGWEAAEEHLRQAMETAIANPRGNSINKRGGKKQKKPSKGDQDKEKKSIETLSAAASAQNLAVFLKARAMTAHPYHHAMMDEAKKLYTDVDRVRSQLLPAQHPDVYATKYSLAELLEAMGDTEAANVLRQEIIDTYDPPSSSPSLSSQEETTTGGSILPPPASESESSSFADADEENNPKREERVVVESTYVAKSQ